MGRLLGDGVQDEVGPKAMLLIDSCMRYISHDIDLMIIIVFVCFYIQVGVYAREHIVNRRSSETIAP